MSSQSEPQLPHHVGPDGLLIGYSLEEEELRPLIGFDFSRSDADKADNVLDPILQTGDGHLITIARTGAGKGVGCIVPALLRYPGPVIIIDPKGENYAVTARQRRALGQDVRVIDPFGITGAKADRLNPLDLIDPAAPDAIDTVAEIAEFLVSEKSTKDPFWDDRARSLIITLILHVSTGRPPLLRHLGEVHYLLNQSREDLDFTFKEMDNSKHENVRQGCALQSTAEAKVFASILSTAQNHTDFLRSPLVIDSLSASTISLDDITSGAPLSIYIVLPPEKLESHGKLLRLWIGVMLSAITRRRKQPRHPTLFILDEAAQLGPLRHLRQAVTLLRGYGVRTWSFWQDLSQLQNLYPREWKTMVNNCEVLQAFGFSNANASRDGALLTGFANWRMLQDLEPDEMVLALAGDEAVIAQKPNYLTDPAFVGLFDPNPMYRPNDGSGHSPRPPARRYSRTLGAKPYQLKEDSAAGTTSIVISDTRSFREIQTLLGLYWESARDRLVARIKAEGLPPCTPESLPGAFFHTLFDAIGASPEPSSTPPPEPSASSKRKSQDQGADADNPGPSLAMPDFTEDRADAEKRSGETQPASALQQSIEGLATAIKAGALDNPDKQILLSAVNDLMLAMMWEIMRRIDKDQEGQS